MKKALIVLIAFFCFCAMFGVAGAEAGSMQSLPDKAELADRVEAVLDYLDLYGKDDYDIIYGVYNYICQTVEYDWASTGNFPWDGESLGCGQTAYEALCEEKAVCAGIARAVTLLLEEMDVPCKYVVGYNDSGIGHAWNLVELGGQWYFMDATADLDLKEYSHFLKCWDDFEGYGISSGNSFDINDLNLATTSYGGNVASRTDSWGGFGFNLGVGNITIHSYTGTEKNLVIPSEINGRPVKRLAQYCIQYNDSIETLTISEGIERIEGLFVGQCNNLKSISIPSTAKLVSKDGMFIVGLNGLVDTCPAMETIMVAEGNPYLRVVDNVLYNKDMTSILYYPPQNRTEVIRVPEGVQTIEDDTFANNIYLKEIILPNSVKRIGFWAFNQCKSLEKVSISKNCEIIEQFAFWGSNLAEVHIPASLEGFTPPAFPPTVHTVTVEEGNPTYYVEDNVLFNYAGRLDLYPAYKTDTVYTIPEGITWTADYAFYGANNLEKVIFPEGFTRVGHSTFYDCKRLTEVVLPDTVTAIEDSAFFDCRNLAKLVIPASVKEIGDHMLANVTGTIIYGEEGSVAQTWAMNNGYAFRNINEDWDVSGTCGDNITWTLSEDGVLTITGTGEMTAYDWAPWDAYRKYIKSVVVSEGITSIAHGAFASCEKLISVSLPKSIVYIGTGAFTQCEELKSIALPDGIFSIGQQAFDGCSNLESIEIPDSVTYFGWGVFDECPKLKAIVDAGSYAYEWCIANNIVCEVKAHTHDEVINMAIEATCTSSGKTEGKYCSICNEVLVPQQNVPATGHTEVIDKAVAATCTTEGKTEGKHCSVCGMVLASQQTVNALGHDETIDAAVPATHITNGLTEGKHCARCSKVLVPQKTIPMVKVPFKITLPKSLQVIEEQAFVDSAFTCVIVPDGCTAISAGAFAGNTSLMFIEIPASVKAIDATAFKDCSKDMVIITTAGSTAAAYAAEHSIYCVIK